jgi:hypothetical protein
LESNDTTGHERGNRESTYNAQRVRNGGHAVSGGSLRTQLTNCTAQSPSTSHANQTYGAETFEDYMQQFMSTKVHYKDFQKAPLHKFDSSKQESFIHWYKLFCTTCLQWGIWCPPYESVLEDHIHGCWWYLLPAPVRSQDTFRSSLLYSALSSENVFPPGSREHGAIQGCPPNAGYNAIYAILRLHHPRLQTVLNTVNGIPRQPRAKIVSTYLQRLHDFMARERIAGCSIYVSAIFPLNGAPSSVALLNVTGALVSRKCSPLLPHHGTIGNHLYPICK